MVHEAKSTGNLSIHITFGMKYPIMNDLISKIANKGLVDEFFRKSVLINPLDNYDEIGTKFKETLKQIIDKVSFDEILAEFKEEQFQKLKINERPVINDFVKRIGLSIDTKICIHPSVILKYHMRGHFLILEINGKEKEFPFFLKPIIEQIVKNSPEGIKIKNISTNFDDKKLLKLMKQFLNLNFLHIVD